MGYGRRERLGKSENRRRLWRKASEIGGNRVSAGRRRRRLSVQWYFEGFQERARREIKGWTKNTWNGIWVLEVFGNKALTEKGLGKWGFF